MSFETDFDTAFTILLGKAASAIPSTTTTTTTSGGTTTIGVSAGIAFIIDGGGSAITAGSKGGVIVPWPCAITQVVLQEFEGVSGSIAVDIQAGVPGPGP